MSVRIGGSRRWDLGVFCCWAEDVFCKMRGQRSLSGQHYHRTLAATTQNIWYGVSAAMAQCRRRRPGPGPAQLPRTVSQNSLRKDLITLRPSSPSYRSRFYSFLKLAVQPDTATRRPGPRQLGAGFWRKASDCIVLATVPCYTGGGLLQ